MTNALLSIALAHSLGCTLLMAPQHAVPPGAGPKDAAAQGAAEPPAAKAPPARRTPAPPSADLAPLAFMAGHWVTELPNGMVSEESWMAPRGGSMLGSFRQTRPDGKPAFFEFTQIVADGDAVTLRQIHVHGNFETDARRKEPMVLRLAERAPGKAVFVPIDDREKSHAGDLASVTYALKDDATLSLRIESRPVRQAPREGDAAGSGAPADAEALAKPVVIEIEMKRSR